MTKINFLKIYAKLIATTISIQKNMHIRVREKSVDLFISDLVLFSFAKKIFFFIFIPEVKSLEL